MCVCAVLLSHARLLTGSRFAVQAIFIPFVGILGNECNRIALIGIGSLWWGGMSVGFGFAHSFQQVWPIVSHGLLLKTLKEMLS